MFLRGAYPDSPLHDIILDALLTHDVDLSGYLRRFLPMIRGSWDIKRAWVLTQAHTGLARIRFEGRGTQATYVARTITTAIVLSRA